MQQSSTYAILLLIAAGCAEPASDHRATTAPAVPPEPTAIQTVERNEVPPAPSASETRDTVASSGASSALLWATEARSPHAWRIGESQIEVSADVYAEDVDEGSPDRLSVEIYVNPRPGHFDSLEQVEACAFQLPVREQRVVFVDDGNGRARVLCKERMNAPPVRTVALSWDDATGRVRVSTNG